MSKYPYQVYVISHLRPQAVPAMAAHLPENAIWCVGEGEAGAYVAAGAANVWETGGLCRSRNQALEHAFASGVACVQVSDDLKWLKHVPQPGKKDTVPMAFTEAVELILERLHDHQAMLGGCAPTANAFYTQRAVSTHLFVVGDLMVVRPSRPRFDDGLRLKEDYDFTVQHLSTYGAVVRCDDVLAAFAHRTNAGGAVAYRTDEREQEAIAHLKAKWPGWFKDNPRRPNEILLATKKV